MSSSTHFPGYKSLSQLTQLFVSSCSCKVGALYLVCSIRKMAPTSCTGGVFLFLLIFGSALSQDKLTEVEQIFAKQGCAQKTKRCSLSLESDFDPPCRDVLGAAQCFFRFCTDIKGTDEEKTAADLLVEYALEKHGCGAEEITVAKILGDFGHAGLLFRKHGCGMGVGRCTKSLRSIRSPFPLCSQLKQIGQCLFNTCRKIRGTKDEEDAKKLIVQYASDNLICDQDDLPEFDDAALGRSTFKLMGKYKEAANTFAKYECQEAIHPCIESLDDDTSPSCSDLMEAGQCVFKSCPAISGKEDEKPTAKLLVEYAEETYGCVASASELLSERNHAPVGRHISGAALPALVLITSLIPVFFV